MRAPRSSSVARPWRTSCGRCGYRPSFFDTVYKELPAQANSLAADTFYGGYRTVTAHENHLTAVAAAHPDLATKYTIGQSWKKTKGQGGHDIQAICLTKKQAGDCTLSTTSPKPKFFLMAQIHARELSTGELAWRWIDYLADGYATDATAKSILDTTEVWVVPIANPDGVDIVASGGNSPKLQRKNADNTRGGCTGTNIGVDLNRNSTFKWGGDSNSPCAETYQGPSAGSEPEAQALEKLARAIFPDQRGTGNNDPAPSTAKGTMITLHSYGNDIIIPWGFTQATSPNDAQYRQAGREVRGVERLPRRHQRGDRRLRHERHHRRLHLRRTRRRERDVRGRRLERHVRRLPAALHLRRQHVLAEEQGCVHHRREGRGGAVPAVSQGRQA